MIIMPVPKDIRTVKSKFIGPFTKRQTFAVVPAGLIAAFCFFALRPFMSAETMIGLIAIIDTPILLCGFVDIYGMPLAVYIKEVAIGKFLSPKHRVYSTENTYGYYATQNKITYEYFDGDTEEYTEKELKKKSKVNKKRLEKFLKENPQMKPLD